MKKIIVGLCVLALSKGVLAQNGESVISASELKASVKPESLPPLPGESEIPKANFKEVADRTLGLTPDQIRSLREMLESRAIAASEEAKPSAKMVNEAVEVSLSPDAPSRTIRVKTGVVTTINILDMTGEPWPVENYIGGHRSVAIDRFDGPKGSMFTINPTAFFVRTNLTLKLKGHNSPIVFEILPGQNEVDYKKDFMLKGLGPNAKVSGSNLPTVDNEALLSLLQGVAPEGSKALKVNTTELKAWRGANGRMYVKTRLSIASPAWISSVRASDGTTAYEMMPAGVILVMWNGEMKSVNIEQ